MTNITYIHWKNFVSQFLRKKTSSSLKNECPIHISKLYIFARFRFICVYYCYSLILLPMIHFFLPVFRFSFFIFRFLFLVFRFLFFVFRFPFFVFRFPFF